MKFYKLYQLHENYNKHNYNEFEECSCGFYNDKYGFNIPILIERMKKHPDFKEYLHDLGLVLEEKLKNFELEAITTAKRLNEIDNKLLKKIMHTPYLSYIICNMFNSDLGNDLKEFDDLQKVRTGVLGGKYDWAIKNIKKIKEMI